MPWEGSRILSARSIQKLSPAFQPFRCSAAGTPGTPCARSGIHSLTLAVTSSQSSIDSVEQKVEGQPRKERSFYFFFFSTYFHYFSLHLFGIMYTIFIIIIFHCPFFTLLYWIHQMCIRLLCPIVNLRPNQLWCCATHVWSTSRVTCVLLQATSKHLKLLQIFESVWTMNQNVAILNLSWFALSSSSSPRQIPLKMQAKCQLS